MIVIAALCGITGSRTHLLLAVHCRNSCRTACLLPDRRILSKAQLWSIASQPLRRSRDAAL